MQDAREPFASLMRDHRRSEREIQDIVASFGKLVQDQEITASIFERLSNLLEFDLVVHILKEEKVLFPAIERTCTELAGAVEDMLEEHERIKRQKEEVLKNLHDLETAHDEVHAEIDAARESLARARDRGIFGSDILCQRLERLNWLLQGHFTGEEDEVFLPAEEIFAPEELASLTEAMALIDAPASADTTG